MAILVWDQVGEHRYETGIDRGVLFLPDGKTVPWNGITSITENLGREVKPYFIDGVQYLAHHVPGSYSAKLQAFTYPDELDEVLGIVEFTPGVRLHDQRAQMFNLSYRTRIGNDVEGVDLGYKVHVVYNVLATPSDRTYNSLSDTMSLSPFEWNLTAVPPQMAGEARPTSHISFDSRKVNTEDQPFLLQIIEEYLYGTEDSDPELPAISDLLFLIGTVGGSIIIS